MSVTDPIADLLSRIRNAIRVRHVTVEVPASRFKVEILKILKEQSLIDNYKISKAPGGLPGSITVLLKYDEQGNPAITSLERVSRPGCRVYVKKKDILPVLSGLGISIVSTSRGLMTGARAIEEGVGGEILCAIY
ncbi:MAG: 30S ribosomal protein S8 [Acidobacteria bacterium]|nr:30S ribosomal protein S8 [Acidobacteriota bacterium]